MSPFIFLLLPLVIPLAHALTNLILHLLPLILIHAVIREERLLGPLHIGTSTAGGRLQYPTEMGNTLQKFLGEQYNNGASTFNKGNPLQNFPGDENSIVVSTFNRGNPLQNFLGDQNNRVASTFNRGGYGSSSSSGCKDEWDEGKRNWKDFQKSLKRKKGGEGDDDDDGGKKKKDDNGDGEGSGEKGRAFGGNVRRRLCDKCNGAFCNLRPIVEGRVCGHMISATCLHTRCKHFPNPPSSVNCFTGKCPVCLTLTRWNLLEGVLDLPEANYIRPPK